MSQRLTQAAHAGLATTLILLPFWWPVVLSRGTLPDLYFTYQSAIVYAPEVALTLSVGLWCASWLLRPRPLAWSPAAWTALGLAGWATASLLWTPDRRLTLAFALHLWLLAGALLLVCTDRPDPRLLALALTVGLSAQAAVALAEAARQGTAFLRPLHLPWPGDLIVSRSGVSVVMDAHGNRWLRAYGTLPHPNILGGLLLLYLGGPALGYLRSGRKLWLLPWLFGAAALLLTFSRAAWVGALAAGFALERSTFERSTFERFPCGDFATLRRRALVLGLSALAVALALIFALRGFFFARLAPAPAGGGTRLERQSREERRALNAAGWQLWRAHPWLGVGAGAYMVAVARLPQPPEPLEPAHSLPLLVVAELGAVGAGLLVGGAAAGAGWRARSRRGKRVGVEAMVCRAIALGVLIASLLDHFWWTLAPGRDAFWLALALWAGGTLAHGDAPATLSR